MGVIDPARRAQLFARGPSRRSPPLAVRGGASTVTGSKSMQAPKGSSLYKAPFDQ